MVVFRFRAAHRAAPAESPATPEFSPMAYELHITKKPNWSFKGPDISGNDWIAYLGSDPELQPSSPVAVTMSDGSTYRHENPFLAKWTGHSSGTPVWFDYRDQHVVVKNPDSETIAKMQRIAKELGARVQGEKGEPYDV